MTVKTLNDLQLTIRDIVIAGTAPMQAPVTFFVIDPHDMTKIIKMEWQQAMTDQEGLVIQLKIIS